MAEVILMPRLSDTMTEGVIAAWHKKVGDSVKKGDLLFVIDPRELEIAVHQAEADLMSARADLMNARAQLTNSRQN